MHPSSCFLQIESIAKRKNQILLPWNQFSPLILRIRARNLVQLKACTMVNLMLNEVLAPVQSDLKNHNSCFEKSQLPSFFIMTSWTKSLIWKTRLSVRKTWKPAFLF
jgi:hypothetical protein